TRARIPRSISSRRDGKPSLVASLLPRARTLRSPTSEGPAAAKRAILPPPPPTPPPRQKKGRVLTRHDSEGVAGIGCLYGAPTHPVYLPLLPLLQPPLPTGISRRLATPMKELHKSGEGGNDMSGASCLSQLSSFPLYKCSRSMVTMVCDFGSLGENINLSPQCSRLSNYGEILERSSCSHISQMDMENPWSHSSTTYAASHETTPKHATEIVKEIAALELEVLHLEQYLLSLYRAAFDRYLATSVVKDQTCEFPSLCQTDFPVKSSRNQEKVKSKQMSFHEQSTPKRSGNDRRNKSCSVDDIKKVQGFCKASRHDLVDSDDRSVPPMKTPSTDSPRTIPCHRSLAEHLGTSIIDCVSETPCKLSEKIVRCISSIYKKLSDPPAPQPDFVASPTSSLSSSSTSSPRDTNDTWSPKYPNESASSPYQSDLSKDKHSSYREMLEVLKVCIDGDKFKYAATALQHFKDLIRSLETIDPRKMEHEEKLAFWINIHNALVMHAFLAYGIHQNYIKSTSAIMKAAYNVGGLSVNAYEIQRSILECQPHRPEPRLQTLFSQSQKFMKRNEKHAYALDKQEPLVHFALCMGTSSDPAVRLYTSKNVLKELEIAKDEYVQSSVSVHKEAKITLPKILQYYAKDASMDLSSILEMVHSCMPEIPQKTIQRFIQGRTEKYVEWLPYKSNFKYTIRRDVAKD
ncbi:hypothetical protein Taro_002671, partial [Colocasia esculenta]|nr:hypothetical protein [Colocasia esculenta]